MQKANNKLTIIHRVLSVFLALLFFISAIGTTYAMITSQHKTNALRGTDFVAGFGIKLGHDLLCQQLLT